MPPRQIKAKLTSKIKSSANETIDSTLNASLSSLLTSLKNKNVSRFLKSLLIIGVTGGLLLALETTGVIDLDTSNEGVSIAANDFDLWRHTATLPNHTDRGVAFRMSYMVDSGDPLDGRPVQVVRSSFPAPHDAEMAVLDRILRSADCTFDYLNSVHIRADSMPCVAPRVGNVHDRISLRHGAPLATDVVYHHTFVGLPIHSGHVRVVNASSVFLTSNPHGYRAYKATRDTSLFYSLVFSTPTPHEVHANITFDDERTLIVMHRHSTIVEYVVNRSLHMDAFSVAAKTGRTTRRFDVRSHGTLSYHDGWSCHASRVADGYEIEDARIDGVPLSQHPILRRTTLRLRANGSLDAFVGHVLMGSLLPPTRAYSSVVSDEELRAADIRSAEFTLSRLPFVVFSMENITTIAPPECLGEYFHRFDASCFLVKDRVRSVRLLHRGGISEIREGHDIPAALRGHTGLLFDGEGGAYYVFGEPYDAYVDASGMQILTPKMAISSDGTWYEVHRNGYRIAYDPTEGADGKSMLREVTVYFPTHEVVHKLSPTLVREGRQTLASNAWC